MFASKPRKVSLTLFCYLALVLAIATVAQADSAAHPLAARDHVNLNRMIKKRAPGLGDLIPGTNGAAGDPPTFNDPSSTPAVSAASSTAASSSAASQSASAASASSSAASASASSAASSSVASSSSAASSSASSSAASSSAESSSTSASSTAASPTSAAAQPTDTPDTQQQPANTSDGNTDNDGNSDGDATHSKSFITQTVTSALPTDTGSAQTVSGAATSESSKAGLTVLIVIASCVGAVAIGWTVIRKWKFKPSSSFEDRMTPIDWQPGMGPQDDGIPGLRRNVSTASHGSFHSSGHSEDSYGHGGYGGGYGAQHGGAGLQPLPDHDFTAGPATLAPVGGYADLARGTSPGPQMAELSRGPSVGHGYGATYNGRY